MSVQEDYKVQLEVFEGPLDLLLYLIKKEEVDIYNIPIEKITTQYMEYLNLMKMLDLNIAGEFIVMAANLMMIKSRMLLPVEERPELEQEEEDPRWELVRQLVEYKKFKDAAAKLEERALYQENVFGIDIEKIGMNEGDAGMALHEVSIFDLITAFKEALKNARTEEFGEIVGHQFTVADKIDYILHKVRGGERTTFRSLFVAGSHRYEIVCTFLALLELIKLSQISVTQDSKFGDIYIAPAFDMPQPVITGVQQEDDGSSKPVEEISGQTEGNENNPVQDIDTEDHEPIG